MIDQSNTSHSTAFIGLGVFDLALIAIGVEEPDVRNISRDTYARFLFFVCPHFRLRLPASSDEPALLPALLNLL